MKNKQESNKDVICGHRLSDREVFNMMMQEFESCFNINNFNETIENIHESADSPNYILIALSSNNTEELI